MDPDPGGLKTCGSGGSGFGSDSQHCSKHKKCLHLIIIFLKVLFTDLDPVLMNSGFNPDPDHNTSKKLVRICKREVGNAAVELVSQVLIFACYSLLPGVDAGRGGEYYKPNRDKSVHFAVTSPLPSSPGTSNSFPLR
jgi:hypothetical protein